MISLKVLNVILKHLLEAEPSPYSCPQILLLITWMWIYLP